MIPTAAYALIILAGPFGSTEECEAMKPEIEAEVVRLECRQISGPAPVSAPAPREKPLVAEPPLCEAPGGSLQ